MRVLACVVGAVLMAVVTGAVHECQRTCVAGDNRTCIYEFHLEEYHTLSRACYDCPSTLSDCAREECVAGDGVARSLLTINRQLPGPDIQVCAGDRIVVDYYNMMLSDTDTLHWHGQHMWNYQYYDGVPFLTQCPILPGAFRYNFLAATPGTHLWHSHMGLHRGSGVFGALVVREAEDPHLGLYDTDLPEHVLVLSDWIHNAISSEFSAHNHYTTSAIPANILVNGKGRNWGAVDASGVIALPLEVVRVSPGFRHRLRLIQGGVFNCPMIFSIDGHTFTIIAVDGHPIIPYTANSLVLYSGERFDVVVEANQEPDNYWIRLNGLIACGTTEAVQGVILRYEGAPEEEPSSTLAYDPNYPPGIVVNPLNSAGGTEEMVSMVDLTSLESSLLADQVDKQFYLALDVNEVNNSIMFNPDLYPFNGVSSEWQTMTPQLNDITFKVPASPPLSQPEAPQPTVCLYGQDPPCEGDFCSCTYVVEVELGETVEFVLIDEGELVTSNHPFHLHGYNFHVVAMDKLGSSTSKEEVAALDAAGGITRKLQDAVKKDTANIPDGGYTIVRFTADNPGWWVMHCHLVYHSELGMVGVLHVGQPSDVPPVPQGFPTCGNYLPDL